MWVIIVFRILHFSMNYDIKGLLMFMFITNINNTVKLREFLKQLPKHIKVSVGIRTKVH